MCLFFPSSTVSWSLQDWISKLQFGTQWPLTNSTIHLWNALVGASEGKSLPTPVFFRIAAYAWIIFSKKAFSKEEFGKGLNNFHCNKKGKVKRRSQLKVETKSFENSSIWKSKFSFKPSILRQFFFRFFIKCCLKNNLNCILRLHQLPEWTQ